MEPKKNYLLLCCFLVVILFNSCQKDVGTQTTEPQSNDEARMLSDQSLNTTVETKPPILYPILTKINANCLGHYVAAPALYKSTTKRYPMIVSISGQQELGTAGTDFNKVLLFGIPKRISDKVFPPNFVVGGKNYSFLVMIPQFVKWPSVEDIKAVITYAVKNYRVDSTRIYLTGFSMGGALSWQYAAKYASKIAAVLPMSGPARLNATTAEYIAKSGVAVWGFHNDYDNIVPSSITKNNVKLINSFSPSIPAKITIRKTGGHNIWDVVTFANYIPADNKTNIYAWMLQYKR
jgi:predicted peptidase